MAKHTATRTPAGMAVSVATGRHRAPIDLRGKATPLVSRNTDDRVPVAYSRKAGGFVPGNKPSVPQTRYVGKGSLYTPRGPRTRYIQYIGNDSGRHTGQLVGEWLLGVVLICFAVPRQAANAGYQKTITRIMYRLTALTAVFFVLALLSDTRGGKAAMYAGLLIDLGIVFNMVQTGSITGITDIMTGKTTLASGTVPAADITTPSSYPIQGGLVSSDGASSGSAGNPAVPA